MKESDIRERIDDILADMDDLASDSDLSLGEVLLEVALATVRQCTGKDLTAEEKAKETSQFLQALQQRAEAHA